MSHYIAEFGGKYLIWSTIVDSPITYLMDEDGLKAYIKAKSGDEGLERLPERMRRVKQHGCSGFRVSKSDLLAWNRAGEQESHIANEQDMVARWIEPDAREGR